MVVAVSIMATAQTPMFDAVSIKVNRTGDQGSRGRVRPGSLIMTNSTLLGVIRSTWDLNAMQVTGGPSWIDRDRFDITATASGNPSREQMTAMSKTMLADRFKLVVHSETRQIPVYALVLARSDGRLGPALRRSSSTCDYSTAGANSTALPPPALAGAELPVCGTNFGDSSLRAGGVPLAMFTRSMATAAGRIIRDRTGLTGLFDIALGFNPAPATATSDAPSLFAAIQEQLGLKLEAQVGPAEVLVIDSAERPSEN